MLHLDSNGKIIGGGGGKTPPNQYWTKKPDRDRANLNIPFYLQEVAGLASVDLSASNVPTETGNILHTFLF